MHFSHNKINFIIMKKIQKSKKHKSKKIYLYTFGELKLVLFYWTDI